MKVRSSAQGERERAERIGVECLYLGRRNARSRLEEEEEEEEGG